VKKILKRQAGLKIEPNTPGIYLLKFKTFDFGIKYSNTQTYGQLRQSDNFGGSEIRMMLLLKCAQGWGSV